MKIVATIVVLLLVSSIAYGIDVDLTITIPDAKVQKVIDAFKARFIMPVDQATGLPLYTDKQWVKVCIKEFIIGTVTWANRAEVLRNLPIDTGVVQ